MSVDVQKTPEQESRERFVRETADHKMTVLHDDGLYRHLRFQRQDGASFYWFDLVTWPGSLVVNGDCGTYTFSRIRDMFEFFGPSGARGGFEDARWGINPQYWAQKLRGPGRDTAREYSHDTFRARVLEWFSDVAEELDEEETAALRSALDEQVLDDSWGEPGEHEAHSRLRDFEHAGHTISDSWEWDLREYEWEFLWCCWAIVWGIDQYRALTSKPEAA